MVENYIYDEGNDFNCLIYENSLFDKIIMINGDNIF